MSNSRILYSPSGIPVASYHYSNSDEPELKRRQAVALQTLFLILTVIILTAVVMGVLGLSLSSRYVFHPGKAICVMTFPNIDASLRFTVAFGILFVVFPAIIISACYARVLQTIRSHRREYDAARGKYDSRSILNRKEMKLSKLVSVIILGFSLCWIPCVIYNKEAVVFAPALYILQMFSIHKCCFKSMDIWFHEQISPERNDLFINISMQIS